MIQSHRAWPACSPGHHFPTPPHPLSCLHSNPFPPHNGHREHTSSSFHSFHAEREPPVGRCPVLPRRPRGRCPAFHVDPEAGVPSFHVDPEGHRLSCGQKYSVLSFEGQVFLQAWAGTLGPQLATVFLEGCETLKWWRLTRGNGLSEI